MKRDTETTVQDMHKIAEIKIIAKWSDGRVEDLATHMPESLAEELEIYCDELEEHRAEVGEDYNFGETP
jgi:molybdopterin-guanine dinucleotide biosynthesis protein A